MRGLLVAAAALLFGINCASACEYIDNELGCIDHRVNTGEHRYIDSEALGIVDSEVDKIMIPPTAEEAAEIKRWIPLACCRSNDCCRKVKSETLTPIDRGIYRVVETGQDRVRLKWSENGYTWRCACDFDSKKRRWIVWPGANTRCIFPVPVGM